MHTDVLFMNSAISSFLFLHLARSGQRSNAVSAHCHCVKAFVVRRLPKLHVKSTKGGKRPSSQIYNYLYRVHTYLYTGKRTDVETTAATLVQCVCYTLLGNPPLQSSSEFRSSKALSTAVAVFALPALIRHASLRCVRSSPLCCYLLTRN